MPHGAGTGSHSLCLEPELLPKGETSRDDPGQEELEGRWPWVRSLLQTQLQIPRGSLGLGLHPSGRPQGSRNSITQLRGIYLLEMLKAPQLKQKTTTG